MARKFPAIRRRLAQASEVLRARSYVPSPAFILLDGRVRRRTIGCLYTRSRPNLRQYTLAPIMPSCGSETRLFEHKSPITSLLRKPRGLSSCFIKHSLARVHTYDLAPLSPSNFIRSLDYSQAVMSLYFTSCALEP